MLLLDSGALTRVMEMIHPPILLAQGWDNVIVNSVMGAIFPLGFTMPASNVAFIVPTTMITEVFLLEDQPVIIGRHQNEAIRVLPKNTSKSISSVTFRPLYKRELKPLCPTDT